jgi:hypothetical protein
VLPEAFHQRRQATVDGPRTPGQLAIPPRGWACRARVSRVTAWWPFDEQPRTGHQVRDDAAPSSAQSEKAESAAGLSTVDPKLLAITAARHPPVLSDVFLDAARAE